METSKQQRITGICLIMVSLLGPGIASSQSAKHTTNNQTNTASVMETQANKETIRKIYAAMNTRNTESLRNSIAEEYTSATGTQGAAGFQEPLAILIKAFPDIHWNIEDLVAEGDKIVVKQKVTGTHANQFQYIAPTGNSIVNDGIAIYTFRQGKVAGSQVYTDRLGFLQQLEVVPTDLAAFANLKYKKEQVEFIDKFIVPAAAKKEFLERVKINRDFIKTLPGFIEDAAYTYTDANNNLVCVTVARWQNKDAVAKAKETVQAEYRKQGFDIAEMMKRLNITLDRGIYTRLEEN
ncbi:MAG TPA: ester cyclase [Ohtaekwangia sp.]|uniref:ester cyclase n=1 Tax=Ohtaekwangia sp. TaxID=2066019 RepID=UPI002F9578CA